MTHRNLCIAMAEKTWTLGVCQQGAMLYTPVLERCFDSSYRSICHTAAIKSGHENGLGMRLMKCCNNWISQPLIHSHNNGGCISVAMSHIWRPEAHSIGVKCQSTHYYTIDWSQVHNINWGPLTWSPISSTVKSVSLEGVSSLPSVSKLDLPSVVPFCRMSEYALTIVNITVVVIE